jgi:hypothetical protein
LGLEHLAQETNVALLNVPPVFTQVGHDSIGPMGFCGERGENGLRCGSLPLLAKRGHMIKGQVLSVEGENYSVKRQDGKEVRLHIDDTTQKTGNIRQGDRIEAEVNDQNHVLSIRSAQ